MRKEPLFAISIMDKKSMKDYESRGGSVLKSAFRFRCMLKQRKMSNI